MDEAEPLTQLDPAFAVLLRIRACWQGAILLAVAAVAEIAAPWPTGLILLPIVAAVAWLVLVVPARRYARCGYLFGEDRLRVVSGYLFYSDTVVPLGRIQHIDLEQGPLMRRFGLTELTVHTAGNHGATVTLRGLTLATAEAIREAIRQHIRQALD